MSSVFDARARSGPQFPQRRALRKAQRAFKKGGEVPGFFLGGLFGGTPGSQTTNSNSTSTSQVTDPNYNSMKDYVLSSGLDLIKNSKFTPYGSNPVVGLTPEQQRGISMTGSNVGNYSPFFSSASGTINGVSGAFDPSKGQNFVDQAAGMQTGSGAASPFIQNGSQTFPGAVGQYMSPYTDNVVKGIQDASNRNFEQNTMRTINDTFSGGAAAQFGRENHGNAVGNAVFAKTQADDAAVSNALQSGYATAGNLFNQDQARQLQAGQMSGSLAQGDIAQQAGLGQTAAGIQGANTAAGTGIAQGQAGLGQATQTAGLTDANALLQAGQVGQTTAQNQSNFNYNEFQQKQQYPFQLLNYGQGLSQGWQLPTQSNTQGTSTSTVQQPQGSPFGQILGGAMSIGSLFMPGLSDRRAKKNIEKIDETRDGQNIYQFEYKGDDTPQVGLMAQEVEKRDPDAVFTRPDGMKMVDYARALKHAFAQGGVVPTVRQIRKSTNPNKGMVPTGMPGMPPMPPMAPGAPQPNGQMQARPFARGGRVDSPFCKVR